MQLPQTNSCFTLNQPPPTNSTSHQVYFLARDTPRCASLPASVPFANFRCFIADILRIEKQFTQTNPNASKNRPFLFKRILFQYKVAECSTVFSLTNWGIVQFVTSVLYEKTKYPIPAQGGYQPQSGSLPIRYFPLETMSIQDSKLAIEVKLTPRIKVCIYTATTFPLTSKLKTPTAKLSAVFCLNPSPSHLAPS